MTLTWIICGAGRGVGKTHLAQRLCEVLPIAVHAKHGCGSRKPGKAAQLFNAEEELASFVDEAHDSCEHVIVESNAWARKRQGDVTIFIDGIAGLTDLRDDVEVLRSAADLQVSPGVSPDAWRPFLQSKLRSPSQCDAVCDLLAQHRRFLANSTGTAEN